MLRNAPIGIYDSGLGGLTVWRTIRDRLPQERVVYYGDTAHVPYGGRPADEIIRFFRDIINHLLCDRVKLIVVACNTSSAIALPQLALETPVSLIGMVQPSIAEAVKVSRNGRIGLMATEGTVRSAAHARLLRGISPDHVVISQACPSLVPLIEAGHRHHPDVVEVVKQCVKPLLTAQVDCIILGCTHYPLVREQIATVVGDVRLLDPAEAVAEQVAAVLHEQDLAVQSGEGEDKIYVSGDPETFMQRAAELGFELGTTAVWARSVVPALR